MEGMEGMEAMGDGDGDTSTGDGDGDPGDGDGDPGDGDGDPGDGDGDTGDGDGDPMECLDLDQDGYGENCPMGTDCDDDDFNNHTVDGCANCMDADQDGQWVGCDVFDENKPGPDCDDADFNVFTPEGCENCVDGDNDMVWVGCDQYGAEKPGPDCNDGNANVGLDDAVELCNGLAENCADEIDNAPPDEMCAPEYPNAPNIAPMNGWCCNPDGPGQDGCEICSCVEQFYDLDQEVMNGCECEATPRTDSLAACSDAPQGYLGSVGEGVQLQDLVIGSVPLIDNGLGNGREDWYSVDFPESGNPGTRPNTGSIQVSFAMNEGSDYRFEVYRSCNGVAFAGSLATQYGVGAPPTREWWFFDNHTAPVDMPIPALYTDDVSWPDTVYIRVFRVQNDATCNNYQLSVSRPDN
ncbi:hypothetical protein ENSA5_45100 [Enhygromyxa salina]|uniref:Uncharacterized protein n=1 Tax=Enhygromyxa salina TaxID=215803 RepID=A0A2S9XJS8_9BACT|nr:hypothetical protein [Enhygromyxa salina]PRP93103.1 hypothetical protein ENSA5_45100 [Enhygromyxa salina]